MEESISMLLKLRYCTKSKRIMSHASLILTHPHERSAVCAPLDCYAFQQECSECLLCLCCSGSTGGIHGLAFMLVWDGAGQQGSRHLGGSWDRAQEWVSVGFLGNSGVCGCPGFSSPFPTWHWAAWLVLVCYPNFINLHYST